MIWKARSRWAFPATAIIAALATLAPAQVTPAEWIAGESSDYCAEINGTYAPDARFFATDRKDKLLVDLPFLSMSALVNLKSRKVIAVPPSILTREVGDHTVKLALPSPPEAPSYSLSTEGSIASFQLETTEVRIHKASTCRTTVAPVWTASPVTDDSSARSCLHQDVRPITATAGCLKWAYMKNSCAAPVVAVVRITQHLFSGTLPETSTFLLPPGTDYALGCAWSSGAMAPTDFNLIAAQFHEKQPMPPKAGQRGPTKP
jgi:hypothetical protein